MLKTWYNYHTICESMVIEFMKIPFLEWVRSQNLSDEAYVLFEESIECYKATAFRASLLFSFLGFQTILKERILESKNPEGYSVDEWNSVQNKFLNDDNWDKEVINAVQNKKKSIFNLNKDLYDQYFYWKDRRNDCAHAKGNMIGGSHVEAFWLFLQSNSLKFRVNGSQEFIIGQIKAHFDPNLTPPKTPIKPLISQIPQTIDKQDVTSFLEELIDLTKSPVYTNRIQVDGKKIPLWEGLLNYLSNPYSEILIKFLTKEDFRSFTLSIFKHSPNMIKHFSEEKTFIRSTWKSFSNITDYKIFIELVKNNLIPKGEIKESILYMFQNVDAEVFDTDTWFVDPIDEIDLIILKGIGFFELFYEKAFKDFNISISFEWANRNKYLVIYYLENFNLDLTIANAIQAAKEARFPPKHLLPLITGFFNRNPEKEEEYKKLVEKTKVKDNV
ncbi:hypothetical protein [Bacillus subtilis]|uniref:hypothetical protein n=4 Tax=Bacillus subtilis TaxID=1423 RepID=UPI000AE07200|nr:hypothetical protein [Bacillus subtilis]MCA4141608.1 hypothetical protein [Bacillus subtilis]QHJ97231.1 hypothetical protein C7M17_00311 [Bacillus subtilis]